MLLQARRNTCNDQCPRRRPSLCNKKEQEPHTALWSSAARPAGGTESEVSKLLAVGQEELRKPFCSVLVRETLQRVVAHLNPTYTCLHHPVPTPVLAQFLAPAVACAVGVLPGCCWRADEGNTKTKSGATEPRFATVLLCFFRLCFRRVGVFLY